MSHCPYPIHDNYPMVYRPRPMPMPRPRPRANPPRTPPMANDEYAAMLFPGVLLFIVLTILIKMF